MGRGMGEARAGNEDARGVVGLPAGELLQDRAGALGEQLVPECEGQMNEWPVIVILVIVGALMVLVMCGGARDE